jgi:hypothetical protein
MSPRRVAARQCLLGNRARELLPSSRIVPEEVAPADLDQNDPDFEVIVTVRAKKAGQERSWP